MGYGIIEREIHVQAAPDVVYEVISRPEHLREWWPDEADLEPTPGATGTVSFGGGSKVVPLTVVEADPPRRFSFFWVYDEGPAPARGSSLLVTFELVPSGTGTLLRFTETGFQEKYPDASVLRERYLEHAAGWDRFLPRLTGYVDRLVSAP